MVKLYKILWLLCVLGLPMQAQAGVSAKLDQYIATFGEAVRLTITADGDVDGEPDIAPLKQDFDILGQSQSSNFSMINGSISRSKSWVYQLMPKRVGMIQVPAITVGKDKTTALMLRVLDASAKRGVQRDIWLEATLSDTKVYVQAEAVLTIKLIRAVNITQGELSEPELQDAVVERLGDDRNYEAVVDGRRVVITERKYAIFPQKAGTLSIPPVQFDGVVSDGRGMFALGKQIRLRSKPLEIHVQAKPAEWDKHKPWLPAKHLTLREVLPEQLPTYRVGEPFTRTIEIRAQGVMAAQLPPLLENTHEANMKAYPDKPELRQEAGAQGLLAIRREKVALVPLRAGRIVLPELRVQWWNVDTGEVQTAIIAAREIEVLPAVRSAGQAQPQAAAPAPVQKPEKAQVPLASASVSAPFTAWWCWLAWTFAALWLLTLLAWWRCSRMQKHTPKPVLGDDAAVDFSRVDKALKQACDKHSAAEVLRLLPAWVSAACKDERVQYLAQVKAHYPELAQPIAMLEQSIYAPHAAQDWDCATLLQALKACRQRAGHDQQQSAALKPLY